jgi:S-adenosylmethionine decarboxylase proenzyme
MKRAILLLLARYSNRWQYAPAKQSQIEGGKAPGLNEKHHCQRQGRRGRSIWRSCSQQIDTYLSIGLIVTFLSAYSASAKEEHSFAGKHFVASYLDCNPRSIGDLDGLLKAMDEAVKSSGASILDRTHHIFPPNGITVVYLLSESHASIHTYPEFGACFVDLFTCGETCASEGFDRILRDYLQPGQTTARQFARSDTIKDIDY